MPSQVKIYNGPFPTTACQLAVATGTAIKTMLQFKPINPLVVRAWGCSFDGSAAAAGVQVELIETGTIFGTGTAFVEADVHKWNSIGDQQVATAAFFAAYSTTTTMYSASSEGTIVASRVLHTRFVQPTGDYEWEFSLGNEPVVQAAFAGRIRVKAAATVNMLCWVLLEL